MQDGQHQRQEEERPAGAHAPTPAVPTPGSPGPVPLACDGGGYGYGMSQVTLPTTHWLQYGSSTPKTPVSWSPTGSTHICTSLSSMIANAACCYMALNTTPVLST